MANGTDSDLRLVHGVLTVSAALSYPRAAAKERSEALLVWRKPSGLGLLDSRVGRIEEDLKASVAASHYREGQPEKSRPSDSARSSTPG